MTLRAFRPEDLDRLKEIVAQTWDLSPFGVDDTKRELFAEVDFLDCLSRSNYSELYCENEIVYGFLLGCFRDEPLREDAEVLKERVKTLQAGRTGDDIDQKIIDFEKLYERINNWLEEVSVIELGVEIVLLAVDKSKQGKGIGRRLVENFLKVAEGKSSLPVGVFTDTTCNYNFYPALGFELRSSERESAALRNDEVIDFYFYTYG